MRNLDVNRCTMGLLDKIQFLIPVLKQQRQADLCDFRASPFYIVSSRLARAT